MVYKVPNKGCMKVDASAVLNGSTDNILPLLGTSQHWNPKWPVMLENNKPMTKKLISMIVNKHTANTKDDAIGTYWGHPYPVMMVPLGGKTG